jgi:hypothetical protein
MTKGGGFAFGARGHDVANFHLVILDDHTSNEQFDQLSALGKGQLGQGRTDPLAKSLEALSEGCDVHLLLRLGIELAPLVGQAVVRLGHLLVFPLELVAVHHIGQRDLQHPGALAFERREGLLEGLPPCLACLRQPCASLGTLQGLGDEHGLGEDTTQIVPDQLVKSARGRVARRTAFPLGGPQGLGPAAAQRRVGARVQGAPRAGQETLATADQTTKQRVMRRSVPSGELALAIETRLCGSAWVLTDDGWHRDGPPRCRRGWLVTLARANRRQGGRAGASWGGARAAPLGRAGRGRRPQDPTHRGHVPACLATGRRHLRIAQALGHPRQTHRDARSAIPRTDRPHHGRLDRSAPHPARVAGAVGIQERTRGGSAPWQELSTAACGLAPPPHPLRNQDAFIRRDRPPHVEQELIMRGITHRTIQQLNAASALTACVDEEPLMHGVTGQTIWGRDAHLCKGRPSGPVPPPLQPWALELGPALAVIAVDRLLGQMPVGLHRDILP